MKKHNFKRIVAALLAVLMVFSLCSCGKNKDDSGLDRKDTLVYGAEFEDEQLNPLLSDEHMFCSPMLYRGLMTTDENCKPAKDIATDVKISDDLLTYDITIRDDVKFHDGKPLKVEDVIFTLETILDEKVNSPLRPEFEEIEKVEKTGDNSLKITLKKPFPALLNKLTIGIVPEHCFKKGEAIEKSDFNKHPIGCGPYKFVSKKDGEKLVLERFDDFYGHKAQIKNIVIKPIADGSTRALQLKNGEVDFTVVDPSQVEEVDKAKDTKVYKIKTADYRCVMFNFAKNDLFDDVRVRQALCYDTNRAGVVKSICHGYGENAYSPLQANPYLEENVEKYKYNPEKAKALLKEAGWEDTDGDGILDKDGEKLSFDLVAPVTDEVRSNMATYLADEWKKIGVDCKVKALDWSAIDIAEVDAFMLGWGSPFDADNDTYRLFTTDAGDNYGGYSNAKVDEALAAGRVETDEAARKANYATFQKELANDPAYDFICYLTALYGSNDRVKGVNTKKVLGHHGAGIFWNIEYWELVK